MARPRTITDEQIAEAARETFIARGPGVPVSAVARRLGVSAAALFQRVGSKEALLRLALRPTAPPCAERLRRGPPHGVPARVELVEVLLELLAFLRQVAPGLVVLRSSGVRLALRAKGPPPPPVELRRLLAQWLRRRGRSGDLPVRSPAATAEGLLGAIEARCFNAYLGGEAFAPGDDRGFVRRLVDGLVGRSGAPPASGDGAS